MLELVNQLDGFDARTDVKLILSTNKIESLDPTLLSKGRIDRKIDFPLPDIKTRRHIFTIHTLKIMLADDVNLEEFVMTKDEFYGVDIKAIYTEVGLLALRERHMKMLKYVMARPLEAKYGIEQSWLDYLDADAAWNCVYEFKDSTCDVVKHTNPSVASPDDIIEAYRLAVKADPVCSLKCWS